MPDPLRDIRPGDRWLAVVAHPDDESFGCGSLLAAAAVRGAEVTVVCATRGEAGQPAAPVTGDLGAVREAELRAAADRLGVHRVEVLGYRDSGFDGDPSPESLCATPIEELADRLTAVVRELRPTVLVVLDGSDGHRDHLHVRSAAHRAVRSVPPPGPVVYEHCLPTSLMRRWLAETAEARGDDAYHALEPAAIGRPDAEITDVVDVSGVLDRREAAMAEHRSQASPFDGLGEELRRAFLTADHLVRVELSGSTP